MKQINTMEKEFIPYELAVKLKELGFNEECFNIYFKTSKNLSKLDGKLHKNYYREGVTCSGIIAPLWQQAFDWILPQLNRVYMECHGDQSDNLQHGVTGYITDFSNKEECLEKLIELVENERIQWQKLNSPTTTVTLKT